jgi:hypothetical protein
MYSLRRKPDRLVDQKPKAQVQMNKTRKIFLFILALVFVVMLAGIGVMTIMEYQARAALPVAEQSAQAIAELYDGAVCLKCDYTRVVIGMFGAASILLTMLSWGIYEIGRAVINRGTIR